MMKARHGETPYYPFGFSPWQELDVSSSLAIEAEPETPVEPEGQL